LASINIVDGEHITRGSAKMNDTYFSTATYNNPNEKLHVVCQEVAHTFGLDHQSTDGSSQNTCMDYFSNTGAYASSSLSTKPNAHDFEELDSIYEHLDSTTTVAAQGAAQFSPVGVTNDPNSWGELVSQSHNGRSSTYERDESDGSVTVTHVYWTYEAASDCNGCDHRFNRYDR
jgi:putative lipoic acid-binding regulatory protein